MFSIAEGKELLQSASDMEITYGEKDRLAALMSAAQGAMNDDAAVETLLARMREAQGLSKGNDLVTALAKKVPAVFSRLAAAVGEGSSIEAHLKLLEILKGDTGVCDAFGGRTKLSKAIGTVNSVGERTAEIVASIKNTKSLFESGATTNLTKALCRTIVAIEKRPAPLDGADNFDLEDDPLERLTKAHESMLSIASDCIAEHKDTLTRVAAKVHSLEIDEVEKSAMSLKGIAGGMEDGTSWHVGFRVMEGETEKDAVVRHFNATLGKASQEEQTKQMEEAATVS
jgi:hypothetical protein